MPTQIEVFEEFLHSRYDARRYENNDPGFTEILHIARSVAVTEQRPEANKPGSPDTYIDLASPSTLNACAFTKDGVDCIALFKGSVEIITKFFDHILADPEAFIGYGDISSQTKPLIRPSLILDTTYTDTEGRKPIHASRQIIADRLRQFAFQFMSAHEIRHIRGGHVQYLKKYFSASSVDETKRSTGLPHDEIITRQTLEMNADAFGVSQGLTNLLGMVNNLDQADRKEAFSQLLELWLYAVCGFFRLIAHERKFKIDEIALEVHPPARVRLMWSLQTVQTWQHCGHLPLTSDETFAIAGRVASRVEADIATITGTPIDLAGALTATDRKVDKHLEVLRERYEQIRPELEELSYSTIPAV